MFDAISVLEKIESVEKKSNNPRFCQANYSVDQKMERLQLILGIILEINENTSEIYKLKAEYFKGSVSAEALSVIIHSLEIAESETGKVIEEALEEWDYSGYLTYVGNLSILENVYGKLLKYENVLNKYKTVHENVRHIVRNYYSRKESKVFTGKGAVYTVITGNYDNLNEPLVIDKDLDYYCFTDNKDIKSENWTIVHIEDDMGLDPIRLNRYYKFLMFKVLPEYDYSIYIDGKNQITGDLKEYIRYYSRDKSMLCAPHPLRQSIEDEIIEVGRLNKADPKFMTEQFEHYKQAGYDESIPLIEGCLLVRNHHDKLLQKVMEDWFDELCKWSFRDQISLGYVCWKNGYAFDLSEILIYENPYIKEIGHAVRTRTVER
ncbi:glycosyltransferase domain-containing protein [Butyrivibrio sp. AE3009]|uniref:glycosyltransferase domain-containing protein n=1 Tax=Butyrivibrio sp. AE3009 TaxID=1280666 RepID=UPI0003B6E689|nr:glycosyltransferase domain-containing protein [Butyrivibrio sp. AE3009]